METTRQIKPSSIACFGCGVGYGAFMSKTSNRVGADFWSLWTVVYVLLTVMLLWLWELSCPVFILEGETNLLTVRWGESETLRRDFERGIRCDCEPIMRASFQCMETASINNPVSVRVLKRYENSSWVRVVNGPSSGKKIWVWNKYLVTRDPNLGWPEKR